MHINTILSKAQNHIACDAKILQWNILFNYLFHAGSSISIIKLVWQCLQCYMSSYKFLKIIIRSYNTVLHK